MFFKKSRMERDIEDFKAMQERAAQRANATESSSHPDAEHPVPVSGDPAAHDPLRSPARGEDDQRQTVVGVDTTWEGKLKTDGSARIEGAVSGEVEAGETVFIERGANVRANVQARRVIVGGAIEGRIICREQLVVERSGRLAGEVKTKTLVIEEGAVVHSQIQMLRDDEPLRARGKNPSAALKQGAAILGAG